MSELDRMYLQALDEQTWIERLRDECRNEDYFDEYPVPEKFKEGSMTDKEAFEQGIKEGMDRIIANRIKGAVTEIVEEGNFCWTCGKRYSKKNMLDDRTCLKCAAIDGDLSRHER